MSYQMPLNARSRNAGRFVRRVQKELQNALSCSGLRQQQVAERLGVDRSIVNRRITGQANLTLRSIADLAWALDHDLVFALKHKARIGSGSTNEHFDRDAGQIATEAAAPKSVPVTIRTGTTVGAEAQGVPTRNTLVSNSVVVRQHEPA